MIGAIFSLLKVENGMYAVVASIVFVSRALDNFTLALTMPLQTLLTCTYRVYFHPLSSFPGPISYKLSGWPLLWQAYTGDRHIHHLLDHEKYGPVVRISPNTLSFSTASALHTIYAPRDANVKKGEWYKTFDIAAGTYSSFTETDKEKHAAKRRWMGPIFSPESLRLNVGKIHAVIERFCETLRDFERESGGEKGNGWSKGWNANEIATYVGFDMMGAVVFGSDFQTVQKESNRSLANSILPASKLMYWVRRYIPLPSYCCLC